MSLEELIEGISILDLPIGVYIVDADGRIARCNDQVKAILGQDVEGKPIETFYRDRKYRTTLFEKLAQCEEHNQPLQKAILPLNVKGKDIFCQDFSRSLGGNEGRGGLLCCIIDYTQEYRFQKLLEELPAGVYQLDRNDRIVYGNDRFAQLHGFKSFQEIQGMNASELYAEPSRLKKFSRLIRDEQEVQNHRAELKRKDASSFIASVTSKVISEDGKYAGREGTILDVTSEEQYRQIIDQMPIGLFKVRRVGDEELIEKCNESFLEINAFKRFRDAIGSPIRQLHQSDASYEEFIKDLKAAHENKKALVSREVPIRNHAGELRFVEVSSRISKESDGVILERVGSVRDITQEINLRRRIELLTRDIGNVLHTYTSTLVSLQHAIDPVAEYLEEGDAEYADSSKGSLDHWVDYLRQPRDRLIGSLAKLIEKRSDDYQGRTFGDKDWRRLQTQVRVLRGEQPTDVPKEVLYALYREAGQEVLGTFSRVRFGHLPREFLRQVRQDAAQLVRSACLITLRIATDNILEMGFQVRSLREFVTSDHRDVTLRKNFYVSDLLRAVIAEHTEFARSRNIDVRLQCPRDVKIRVHERDLLRALGNLVHNAIKYSWEKPGHAWVTINVRVDEDKPHWVHVDIDNWGVPIPDDELESVFKIGIRGRLSTDRRRTGTGIGLADARRVAREHNGEITISSRPTGNRPQHDYSKPFITTATISLPIAGYTTTEG